MNIYIKTHLQDQPLAEKDEVVTRQASEANAATQNSWQRVFIAFSFRFHIFQFVFLLLLLLLRLFAFFFLLHVFPVYAYLYMGLIFLLFFFLDTGTPASDQQEEEEDQWQQHTSQHCRKLKRRASHARHVTHDTDTDTTTERDFSWLETDILSTSDMYKVSQNVAPFFPNGRKVQNCESCLVFFWATMQRQTEK